MGWRRMTWAIVAWTVLVGGYVALMVWAWAADPPYCPPGDAVCSTNELVGLVLAVLAVAAVWFAGFIVLALVWLMSRPRA